MNIINGERIQGYMPTQYLRWFAEKAKDCKSIVEIGCWRGRTTRVLCDNCPGMVTAVDTWKGCAGVMEELQYMSDISGDPDWLYNEFCHNMRFPEVKTAEGATLFNLLVYRMTSLAAATCMHYEGRLFDMVIIDASHDYESVKADLEAWAPLVSYGGILCGHDYKFPDVQRAVREAFPIIQPSSDADLWVITAPQVQDGSKVPSFA